MSGVRQFALVALALPLMAGLLVTAQQRPVDAPAAPASSGITLDTFRPLHVARALLVVDVRGSSSFREGHIPGAINVPVAEIADRVPELRVAARGRPVVTYCACPAEQTSIDAALLLRQRGFVSARALVGGYVAWVKAGGDVERPPG